MVTNTIISFDKIDKITLTKKLIIPEMRGNLLMECIH